MNQTSMLRELAKASQNGLLNEGEVRKVTGTRQAPRPVASPKIIRSTHE